MLLQPELIADPVEEFVPTANVHVSCSVRVMVQICCTRDMVVVTMDLFLNTTGFRFYSMAPIVVDRRGTN